MSSQFKQPASFTPAARTARWTPENVWRIWRRESYCLCREPTLVFLVL